MADRNVSEAPFASRHSETCAWRFGMNAACDCRLAESDESYTGTCQGCGAYWDVRLYPVCPCGGEVL